MTKRLRIFAGPNGSGKSTIEHLVSSNYKIGKLVNAAYSYLGAILSEFIRTKLLDVGKTFSFETVMSHESKLDFILEARKKGFKTYLYFVSTESADINVAELKVELSMVALDLLAKAVKFSDRAFIFDNSGFSTPLLADKNEGNLKILKSEVPDWFNKYLIERLKGG